MKEFFLALKDNLSNIFSVIGICLTVYFAVFYVPNYVEELEIKKVENTHESLVESIQELVYNGYSIDSNDIETLIRGKELSEQMTYPFTPIELLIQVQDRFISNKFIPLEQRKNLIEKIDEIKNQLPDLPDKIPSKDEKPLFILLFPWVSALLGITAAIFGFISIWSRSTRLEEIKFESNLEDRQESFKNALHTSIQMEKSIYETLKNALGPDHVEYCPPSSPVDFIIRNEHGVDTAVEVKYTETEIIPLRVINKLIVSAIELQMPVVLISNANITAAAKNKIAEFNRKHREVRISCFNWEESNEIVSDIKKLFSATS